MIYELKDTTKAAALFAGIEDSMVQTCLQGLMGCGIYVTDLEHPRSALASGACFSWYAGEPDRELVAFKPKGVVGMVPPDEAWAKLIEECWPYADKVTRYAIKKDTKFDRRKLEQLVAALPEGYALCKIDEAIFDRIFDDELFEDCVSHFESKEQFFELGRGYAVLKDGKPVCAASSYTVYREGIEIEIDTAEEERRKGLASAACAKLILSCLGDGLYPSWDAANRISVALAEKLGYEFSHEYPCYWLDEIVDRALPNPNKSGWDDLCGVYESESEDHKRFTILRKSGDLYAKFVSTQGDPLEMMLFPLAENTFGLMWGDDEIVFSDSAMTVNGKHCRKLQTNDKETIIMDKNYEMQKLARESFEKGGFNGAWLYAENGEIVSKGVVGFCDPEDKKPLTEDTIFQLASVSKQFTASAVMLAVRQGLFGLDDRIIQYFPELTAYAGVTVRHLLTHTGGVPDYFDDADWFIKVWKEEKHVPSNDEILRFLLETKCAPDFAPGESISYSNTGYNLLALLVERRSGMPYEDFLQKYIFEPAGMANTRCCHIRRDGVPFDNYAQATVLENDRYVRDVDSEEDGDVVAFDGLNGDDYVYTTIFDMLRWDRVLRAGTVLTPEEQQQMYTPGKLNNGGDALYDEDEGLRYGFGWAIENNEELGLIVSHSGGMPGVGTWFERFLDADRTLVFMECRDPRDYRALSGFWNGIQKLARGEAADPIRTIEEIAVKDPDKSKWESFCGKYEHPTESDFIVDEVWMQDGELWAKCIDDDGDDMTFRLYPIGENEFGRKGGMVNIAFTDGFVTVGGEEPCKKL